MKKFLALSLFTTAILYGCSDTSTTPTPNVTGNGYMPLTTGSSWDYEHNDHDILFYSTKKITGDSVINGMKYAKLVQVNQGKESKPQLVRRSNDSLFFFQKNADTFSYVERKGVTWSKHDTADSSTTVFSVLEQGVPHTVRGTTYPDVMYVRTVTSGFSNGKAYEYQQHYYYAKNIGMIEARLEEKYVMTLISYVVK